MNIYEVLAKILIYFIGSFMLGYFFYYNPKSEEPKNTRIMIMMAVIASVLCTAIDVFS